MVLSRSCDAFCVDRNHPSIIIWSLGNEASNGASFFKAYAQARAADPSRPIQYESWNSRYCYSWEQGCKTIHGNQANNTDIFVPMYATVDEIRNYAEQFARVSNARPLILCEFAHAMGNSVGNFLEACLALSPASSLSSSLPGYTCHSGYLAHNFPLFVWPALQYMELFHRHPSLQGGFIWDWMDQGLRRPADQTTTCLEQGKCSLSSDDAGPPDALRQFYGYGGDYGPAGTPTDSNFLFNGLIDPDFVWHPAAHEVKFGFQSIEG